MPQMKSKMPTFSLAEGCITATFVTGMFTPDDAKRLLDSLYFGTEVPIVAPSGILIWRLRVITRIAPQVITMDVVYKANGSLTDDAKRAIEADADANVLAKVEMVLTDNNVINNSSPAPQPAPAPAPPTPAPGGGGGNQGGGRGGNVPGGRP